MLKSGMHFLNKINVSNPLYAWGLCTQAKGTARWEQRSKHTVLGNGPVVIMIHAQICQRDSFTPMPISPCVDKVLATGIDLTKVLRSSSYGKMKIWDFVGYLRFSSSCWKFIVVYDKICSHNGQVVMM